MQCYRFCGEALDVVRVYLYSGGEITLTEISATFSLSVVVRHEQRRTLHDPVEQPSTGPAWQGACTAWGRKKTKQSIEEEQ